MRENLVGAHPVVSTLNGLLKKQELDRDGIVAVYCDGQATLRTTLGQKDRVLLLLDALVRALVARGHSFELRHAGTHQHGVRVVVSDEQDALRVSIIERLVRSDHVLTTEEKRAQRERGTAGPRSTITGHLGGSRSSCSKSTTRGPSRSGKTRRVVLSKASSARSFCELKRSSESCAISVGSGKRSGALVRRTRRSVLASTSCASIASSSPKTS